MRLVQYIIRQDTYFMSVSCSQSLNKKTNCNWMRVKSCTVFRVFKSNLCCYFGTMFNQRKRNFTCSKWELHLSYMNVQKGVIRLSKGIKPKKIYTLKFYAFVIVSWITNITTWFLLFRLMPSASSRVSLLNTYESL